MLRFKTEQEFIADYGSEWRIKVPHSFTVEMDFLLGTVYNKENLYNYSISTEMLTPINDGSFMPYKKPKKDATMRWGINSLLYGDHTTLKSAEISFCSSPTDNCQIQAMNLNPLFEIEEDTKKITSILRKFKSMFGLKNQAMVQVDKKYEDKINRLPTKAVFTVNDLLIALIVL